MKIGILATSAVVLALAGCTAPTNPVPEPLPPIQTDVTSPMALVVAYGEALERLDVDAYAALLERPGPTEGFRFQGYDQNAELFPWLESPSWGYTIEVTIISDLMDSEPEGGPPVAAIRAAFQVLSQREVDDEIELLLAAQIHVEADAARNWYADTKLDLRLAIDDRGFLRMRSMREHDPIGGTWTCAKGRCRR